MKKQFALTVPTPCHENWNTFTPTQKGKFCGACQKEVIDFTARTDDEIKHYFKNNTQSTCGRFKQQQLKIYPTTEVRPKSHSAWAAFVAFLMLLVHEPAEAQTATPAQQEQFDEQKQEAKLSKALTSITIKGIVIDDTDSLGIPGVNVVRKGTTEGTVTDANGKFELTINSLKANETLIVSFIGLNTTEVSISPNTDSSNLKITMSPDLRALGEVVVVGGAVCVKWYSPRGLWWKLKNLFRRY
jgi:hypothetical protein